MCHLGSKVAVTPSHSPLALAANASHELIVDATSSLTFNPTPSGVADRVTRLVYLLSCRVERECLLLTHSRRIPGTGHPFCHGLTSGPFDTLKVLGGPLDPCMMSPTCGEIASPCSWTSRSKGQEAARLAQAESSPSGMLAGRLRPPQMQLR